MRGRSGARPHRWTRHGMDWSWPPRNGIRRRHPAYGREETRARQPPHDALDQHRGQEDCRTARPSFVCRVIDARIAVSRSVMGRPARRARRARRAPTRAAARPSRVPRPGELRSGGETRWQLPIGVPGGPGHVTHPRTDQAACSCARARRFLRCVPGSGRCEERIGRPATPHRLRRLRRVARRADRPLCSKPAGSADRSR